MDILSKSFLTSTTFWGIVVSIVAQVAQHFGWSLDTAGLTNDLVSAAGLGLAMYGRFTAIQPLHVVTQTATPIPPAQTTTLTATVQNSPLQGKPDAKP